MTSGAASRRALLACSVALLVLLRADAFAADSTQQAAAPDRDSRHYVSIKGSDANPGTRARPWRTIGKAMAALQPGQTAYVRAGVYVEADTGACRVGYNALQWTRSGTAGDPITIAAYPGEGHKVIVRTQINIRGDHLRLVGLVVDHNSTYDVDGACAGGANVAVWGNDVDLVGLEVRRSGMTGVYLYEAEHVTISRSWIHDNGSHVNADHGIYVSSSTSLLVANNIIEGNRAFGIHIYPELTRDARILQNTVVGNGRGGLVIYGDSERNTIANNIFAFNHDFGVQEYKLEGGDNRLVSNLFFGNGEAAVSSHERLSEAESYFENPRFVNRQAHDFRLGPRSGALDRADRALSRPFDYRGHKRPVGAGPDVGAFER